MTRARCSVPRCRHKAKKHRTLCAMHIMRSYRQRHLIRAAWHRHCAKARERGVPVEWTFDEFEAFCHRTNYHIEVKNGLTIERDNPLLGYSTTNCSTLGHLDNSIKGSKVDRWLWAKIGGRAAA